jgi:Trm5-related predicted tRNA methylase
MKCHAREPVEDAIKTVMDGLMRLTRMYDELARHGHIDDSLNVILPQAVVQIWLATYSHS